MNDKEESRDESISRSLTPFISELLRLISLSVLFVVLYVILVFPIAIALLGDHGQSVATIVLFVSGGWSWFVAKDFKLDASRLVLIVFAITVMMGIATASGEWIVNVYGRGQSALLWDGGFALIAGLMAGFVLGLVGVHSDSSNSMQNRLAERDVMQKLALIPFFLLFIFLGPGMQPDLQGWHWVPAVISVAALTSLAVAVAFIGRWIGRAVRMWLMALGWIWESLRSLGPPLGLFLTGYVSMGVFFGTVHAAIWQTNKAAYSPEVIHGSIRHFLYFSFVTLTTVGYGDIHPVSGWARLCTVIEILLGQLWIVLVLGIVLSRPYPREAQKPQPPDA